MATCLAFLTGLVVGVFLGIASIALCKVGKKADNSFEHECNAPYPRIPD